MANAKQAAIQLVQSLPDESSWDDIMYELYVKQKLEQGLAEIDAGETRSHDALKSALLDSGD